MRRLRPVFVVFLVLVALWLVILVPVLLCSTQAPIIESNNVQEKTMSLQPNNQIQLTKSEPENTITSLQPMLPMGPGKVGIFCHGQHGDISVITSVFKYRHQLWPGKDLVWFVSGDSLRDLFKFNDFIELRDWPQGWDLPERCHPDGPDNVYARAHGQTLFENWFILKQDNNRLDMSKKHLFERTKDLDDGYFPAPHHMTPEQRHGIEYSNISRVVFGVPLSMPWHPVLFWSEAEKQAVKEFCSQFKYRKTILFETFGGSGQTWLNDAMIRRALQLCRDHTPDVNIVFVSHKYLNQAYGSETFPQDILEQDGVYHAAHFTVRQCALLIEYADLMICVSSGISVTTSAWGLKPTPKLQYCGSEIGSTLAIANGPMYLVTTDDTTDRSRVENLFYSRLSALLPIYV
jgi:hypothetical protein